MINPPKRDGWLLQSDKVAAAVVEGTRFGDWMQTFTGKQFWPMDPRADEIDIADIAHSLSMQCRYAGHSLRFYSVAEHSTLVAKWILDNGTRWDALAGLLHDATEAYLVDVPRPVKPFLNGYREAEARMWNAVAQRFWGYEFDLPPIVHEADNRILCDERAQNMAPSQADWNIPDNPLGITLQFWSPEQAEAGFLRMFNQLTEAA